jgi:hypothetical protein
MRTSYSFNYDYYVTILYCNFRFDICFEVVVFNSSKGVMLQYVAYLLRVAILGLFYALSFRLMHTARLLFIIMLHTWFLLS